LLKKGNLTFKIFLFLVSVDFLETFTQFCFKKTALPESAFEISAFADVLIFLKLMLFSPFLWLGLTSVLFTFIIWSTILSKIDLSVAVPVCSFSYITIPLVSIIFLHEKVTYLRWMGIFLILIGVIFVSLSSKHQEAAE
jgi:drug/metabolite transporter (DMT)-like permease